MTKQDALMALMKHHKINRRKLAESMGITQPTIRKFLLNPELMTGVNRRRMAAAIGVPVTGIDDICNGRFEVKETA